MRDIKWGEWKGKARIEREREEIVIVEKREFHRVFSSLHRSSRYFLPVFLFECLFSFPHKFRAFLKRGLNLTLRNRRLTKDPINKFWIAIFGAGQFRFLGPPSKNLSFSQTGYNSSFSSFSQRSTSATSLQSDPLFHLMLKEENASKKRWKHTFKRHTYIYYKFPSLWSLIEERERERGGKFFEMESAWGKKRRGKNWKYMRRKSIMKWSWSGILITFSSNHYLTIGGLSFCSSLIR